MLPEERLKVRVEFSKTGSLKFISHLDLARTMKAAFLRSKLPIWYTMGFNPHPKLVFSVPLSVGTASKCEFMDFMLTESVLGDEIVKKLNDAFPADLRAKRAYTPESRFCDIGWARYSICLITNNADENTCEKIKDLFEGQVIVSKTTKTGTKEIDISSLCDIESIIKCDAGIEISVLLSCGENTFVNPKHIIDKIEEKMPELLSGGDYTVCREAVFLSDKTTPFM